MIIFLLCCLYFISFAMIGWGIYMKLQIKKPRRKLIYAHHEANALYRMAKPVIDIFATYNQGLSLKRYEEKIERKLSAAGHPGEMTPSEFLAVKQLCILIGLGWDFLFFLKIGFNIFLFIGVPVFCLFLPNIWLSGRIKKRQRAIVRSLPYNLDLLTLSVEAGMDFTAAIGKVVEISQAGPLIEEFYQALQEIKMGKTRRDALHDMSTRIGLREISSFTGAIIQADLLGTSLGPILRAQAEQITLEREQNAEKRAMEAPVKMLFPLLVFIFPTVFIIIAVPIAIRIFQTLGG